MKTQLIAILVFLSILYNISIPGQVQEIIFNSEIAEIYKGNIEDAADYIASFPTDAETDQILNQLNSISEEIRATLYGEIPPETERIKEITEYVYKVYRETDILQWNILQMHKNQIVSLLPGEGIKLTLHSYCLNKDAASPSEDEFYYIDAIPEEQEEWLVPITDFVSKNPGKDFPAQGLIWNMNNDVAYYDLPSGQRELLTSAIPNAEEKYGRDIIEEGIKNVFDPFKSRAEEEVKNLGRDIEVIDDISEIAEELENRISELKLVIPLYDTYQTSNGLLIKAESTGSYKSIKLTIVNPRTSNVGYNINLNNRSSLVSVQYSAGEIANNFLSNENYINAFISGKWKDRLEKLEGLSDKCEKARNTLQDFNKFSDNPEGYIKGRGFDEGLDFFKAGIKGNKKAEEAFELFRSFNHDMLYAQKKSDGRPKDKGLKDFSPSDSKFNPGRGDVQPLKPVFGCG